ncbi:hypothetical protein DNTS_033802, partial [Danionella cerebrum]
SEAPGVSEERELNTETTGAPIIYNPHLALSHRNNILYLVESFQTVVIVGETGSGKSTQIPQYLLEAGWAAEGKVIGVTQPRRVAATSVAARVAEERGAFLGHEVGYTIRFDDCSDSQATRIKFLTDGMLVREMMADPLLKKYSVLMLDEAHERTLNTDIVIGLLKKIQKKRRDLRLIIASATLDAKKFQDFFNLNDSGDPSKDTCGILSIEGRTFPVDIFYTIHEAEEDGDVLAFLTGQEEVEKVVSLVKEQARTLSRGGMKKHLCVLPMYAGLPHKEQMRVFERVPPTVRKVVVATNIAETSITINGVVFVIDCAFVKLKAYNPHTAIESLLVTPISKASACQRAGRAGRSRPGKCFRLYTEEDYEKLPETTVPEMQRSCLAPVILQLKALGVDNVLRFSFLSPPPAQSMVQALELLFALGGLDQFGRLSDPLGVRMAEFPLGPMFAKMLLESGTFGCSSEVVTIASMMQIQNIFLQPHNQKKVAAREHRKFAVVEGDHLTMLNVYEAFIKHQKSSQWCQEHFLHYKGLMRAVAVREQLRRLLNKFKIPRSSSQGPFVTTGSCTFTLIRCCMGKSLPNAELCVCRVVFNEVVQTSKFFMRDVTAVESSWLVELAPHFYKQATHGSLNSKRSKAF